MAPKNKNAKIFKFESFFPKNKEKKSEKRSIVYDVCFYSGIGEISKFILVDEKRRKIVKAVVEIVNETNKNKIRSSKLGLMRLVLKLGKNERTIQDREPNINYLRLHR